MATGTFLKWLGVDFEIFTKPDIADCGHDSCLTKETKNGSNWSVCIYTKTGGAS